MKNEQASGTKGSKTTAQTKSGKNSTGKGKTANEVNSAISSPSENTRPRTGHGLANEGTNFSYREERD